MAFRGKCIVDAVGLDNGQTTVWLKAVDGSFDVTPFRPQPDHEREFLAIALAAITANKLIDISTETAAPWLQLSWFFVGK